MLTQKFNLAANYLPNVCRCTTSTNNILWLQTTINNISQLGSIRHNFRRKLSLHLQHFHCEHYYHWYLTPLYCSYWLQYYYITAVYPFCLESDSQIVMLQHTIIILPSLSRLGTTTDMTIVLSCYHYHISDRYVALPLSLQLLRIIISQLKQYHLSHPCTYHLYTYCTRYEKPCNCLNSEFDS